MKLRGDRAVGSGLALRLATMILIALLPLGLLSLAQTRTTMRQANETRLAAAVGQTLQEALREIRLIRASQVTAQLFASSLRSRPADCAARARSYATSAGQIARAAFIGRDGKSVCSSDGEAQDLSQSSRLAEITGANEPLIFHDPAWSRAGGNDISLTWPVLNDRDEAMGFVLLSLPESALLATPRDQRGPGRMAQPANGVRADAIIALNRAGEVIYASSGIASAADYMPSEQSLQGLLLSDAKGFFGDSATGRRQMFGWAPVSADLYLLGVWPLPDQDGFFYRQFLPWVIPALMWLAAIGVTILGVERLVTRHIRRLSRAMRDFTSENRIARELALDNPPAEIATLAEAYRTLTATILRDEAELENLVRQKAELLREVHHRTGNSLQLIASFLRMHRRETEDADIRSVLDDLHNRVMSLSSVHMGLYRMAGGSAVAVDLLMAEVIAKVDLIHGRSGQKQPVQTEFMPLLLPSQQAVPLALLLAELLSCFPPAEAGNQPVRIRLTHGPEQQGPEQQRPEQQGPESGEDSGAGHEILDQIATLEVSGAATARGRLTGADSGAPAVIGARLIRGFATQLSGELQILDDGERVRAVVKFAFEPTDPDDDDARLAGIAPGLATSGPDKRVLH